MKIVVFWFKFHWNLFLWFQLIISYDWLGFDGLATTHNLNKKKMALFTDIYGSLSLNELTHWGWVTHICVSDLTIISSDNGLSPGRRQAIIRTNAGILLIRPLGTNFSEILIEILIFSFKKMRLKVSSAKRRPFCLGLNELIDELVTYEVVWSFLWDSCMMVYLLINADEYCSTTHHNHKKNVKVKKLMEDILFC